MKSILLIMAVCFSSGVFAQDSAVMGIVTVYKDPRIDLLSKTISKVNYYSKVYGARSAKGYRLMVLSTNDRDFAMKVRAQLLQKFPDQKVYMTYQVPNIRLKFGNFLDKGEAEKYKKLISNGKIVPNNIYVVPETIEVKMNKDKDKVTE